MKLYQRLVLIALGSLAMFAISGCDARAPATQHTQERGAGAAVTTAGFDYYLLALSLAPAFCEDAIGNRRVPHQCRDTTLAAFQKMPLTLHGLWPNSLSGQHPFDCGSDRRQGSMCSLDSVRLPRELSARLETVMPGTADCLDRHEWSKHGACSGLSQSDYFDQSILLVERVNRAMGTLLAAHAGQEVALDALRAALKQHDPELLESVTFDCRTPRSQSPERRKPMLREVRVYFRALPDGRPGTPMNFREVGVKHYNSGCPAGRAYVDAP